MKEHITEYKHGDVVCAKIQTAGRGRRSRSWVSSEGNLHISVLLNQIEYPYTNFEVVMRTSITIVKLLEKIGIKASIKYPNDIVVGKRKIAGILIEKLEQAFIVGCGINVSFKNTDLYDFHPTSILIETGNVMDYRDVLSLFIDTYNEYIDHSIEEIFFIYKDYSLVVGKEILYNDTLYEVMDVLITGELILKHDEERIHVMLNEVTMQDFYGKK